MTVLSEIKETRLIYFGVFQFNAILDLTWFVLIEQHLRKPFIWLKMKLKF